MQIKKFRRALPLRLSTQSVSGLVGLMLTLTSGMSIADDTEIFFGRDTAQPNILLIVDTSQSMSNKDGTGVTRLARIQTALKEILNTTQAANIGLMEFHGGGNHLWHAVKPIDDTHRANMVATIDNLNLHIATPTVNALLEGARYFKGDALSAEARLRTFDSEQHTYTCASPNNITGACFSAPKIDPTNDSWGQRTFKWYAAQRVFDPDAYDFGPATGSIEAGAFERHEHCTPDNLTHRSCGKEKIVGNASYKSPITSECQSNHVVLLTDGLPWRLEQFRNDDIENKIEAELGITCHADGYPAGYPSHGRCASDIAEYMDTTDLSDVSGNNTVTTHTIGLELDVPWLNSISAASADGTHYSANSAQSLVTAFESIIAVSQKELNTFVAPAVTVDSFTGLSHRDDVYLPLFIPSSRANWAGNLKRYSFTGSAPVVTDLNGNVALDDSGAFLPTAQSWWSSAADGNTTTLGGAASKLDADNRRVYTNISGATLTDESNKVHEDNGLITTAELNIPAWRTARRTNIIKWTRGVDVHDHDDNPTTITRKQMGDPLHSQPVLVTYGRTLSQEATAATETDPATPATYNLDSVAFVGTNQGYLHAIDTNTGEEVFSFIPKELLPNLQSFYDNQTTINKVYGLDGDITTWIKDQNGDGAVNTGDHAYLYVGMRRGGNNYYALNVTDTDNPSVLWTINGGEAGDFAELGQTWSKPTLRTIMHNGVKTKVLVFAGGYDSMQDNSSMRSADTIGNAIFVVDATTGALIWKATNSTSSTDLTSYDEMKYSMPSDPTVIDINADGLADQIYVGDMGGQVWRFDFNNHTTDAASLTGGVIANLSTDAADGVRRFFYAPDVAYIKGDSPAKSYLSVSVGSGNRAHPLDTVVNDRFYMIKQFDIFNAPAEYGIKPDETSAYRPVTEADLYDVITNDIESSDTNVADAAKTSLSTSGWMLELTLPGEKVLSSSLSFDSTLTFVTYLPEASSDDICSPAIGGSRMYRVNLKDATPADGNSSRTTDLPGSGITSTPYLFFDKEGKINEVVHFTNVNTTDPGPAKRTFWSEQTD